MSEDKVTNLHNEYIKRLNEAASINVTNFNAEQNFMVGQLIYGDLSFRQPAIQEAKTYAMAGADVYMLYFDTDTTWDVFTIHSGLSQNQGLVIYKILRQSHKTQVQNSLDS